MNVLFSEVILNDSDIEMFQDPKERADKSGEKSPKPMKVYGKAKAKPKKKIEASVKK